MSFLTNTFFVSKNVESEVKFQAHSQSQVAKESKSLNCIPVKCLRIESQSEWKELVPSKSSSQYPQVQVESTVLVVLQYYTTVYC